MSEQKDQTPYYHGGHPGKQPEEECRPPQPPTPPPCPDPCDQNPLWGPPGIRPECCPDDRECCPEDQRGCTWDEVDDPCVRASSCVADWTKVDCKCNSSNAECDCEEWDCSCYPKGGCVPCKPCEGLLPEGDPTDGCEEPPREDCSAADLRIQLDALQHCISSQQGEKAKIDADIQAREGRAKSLEDLIKFFDEDKLKPYREQRQKLICSEDCLKGFYRDMSRVFHDKYKFPDGCLQKLQDSINAELCKLEREKCCQKNLEGKLNKVTKLIWEQQQAKKASEKADEAFRNIQDLATWIGKQFADLEALKTQIDTAINSTNPNDHQWAFYLFYWKFVPKLCRRFPVAICCDQNKEDDSQQSRRYPEHHQSEECPSYHIGCEPGDWHPSVITEKKLTKLICCAWDYVRKQKEKSQEADGRVKEAERNLEFIKAKVTADETALEGQIKNRLNAVECKPAPSSK